MKETCNYGKPELRYEFLATSHNDNTEGFIHEHLATLYFIVKEFDATSILEIGTGHGASLLTFAEAGAQIMTVDIDPCEYARKITNQYKNQIQFMHGASEDLELEKDMTFDILFIDGLHTYDQVALELAMFAHRATKFIILHDLTNPEHTGVNQAIIEFRRKNTDWEYYQWFHNNGLAVLARR